MEPYKIEKLPGEAIVVFTARENFKIKDHVEQSMADAWEYLDAQPEVVYYVNDLSRQTKPSLDDLMVAASALARGSSALYRHSKIRNVIAVTTDALLRLAYKGASAEVFGRLQIEVFGTLDEALEYIRSRP